MSKLAALKAALNGDTADTGVSEKHGKVPFDGKVWQQQDDGDYIHIKTGEIRSADDFGVNSEDESDTRNEDNDFGSQDAGDEASDSQVWSGRKKR